MGTRRQIYRFAAFPAGCALFLAYLLAPFQHVHADHGHAAVVHSHFYSRFHVHNAPKEPRFDDVDDHASVRPLDTFTLAFAPQMAPFVLLRGPVVEPISSRRPQPVIAVEERAHDPPQLVSLPPRAPPA